MHACSGNHGAFVNGCMIRHASCFNALPSLPSDSVDLILTDPPYDRTSDPASVYQNKGFSDAEWRDLLSHGTRVLRTGGKQLIFCNNTLRLQLEGIVRSTPELTMDAPYTWQHRGYTTVDDRCSSRYREPSDIEYILVIYERGTARQSMYIKDQNRSRNLGSFPRPPRRHFQVKHEALYREILGRYHPGIVLDYCMCTGACGEVALEMGHRFIGFEIVRSLFESAKSRLVRAA